MYSSFIASRPGLKDAFVHIRQVPKSHVLAKMVTTNAINKVGISYFISSSSVIR